MKNDFDNFPSYFSDAVGKNIISPLKQRLDSLHIYYKETNRFKSVESLKNKISKKIEHNPDYLMQDGFGCRFIFYFYPITFYIITFCYWILCYNFCSYIC